MNTTHKYVIFKRDPHARKKQQLLHGCCAAIFVHSHIHKWCVMYRSFSTKKGCIKIKQTISEQTLEDYLFKCLVETRASL